MAKIGFIGMGNMGTAIMRGLLKTYKPEELLFTSAHEAKMQKITEETGVAHVSTATDCAEQVKYLVLAVKPQVLPTVFKELNGKIRKDQVVISIWICDRGSPGRSRRQCENRPLHAEYTGYGRRGNVRGELR